MSKIKSVWLVEAFDCLSPDESDIVEIKVALTEERAKEYARELADEYRQWLLDEEYSDEEIEPVVGEISANQFEVVDANDEQRWIISWHEAEVV